MDEEHSEIGAQPNKIGYCDWHLDSEMIPVGVFQAGVYGGDSGDCAAMEYWRCSRAECSRSYEPWRFGYFNLVWVRGSRIEMNPCNQHRCGKHDEVIPFLFIAKVGDGRQFMCPHRGCFERGPVVAEHFPDTPNPTDPTPVTAEPRRDRNKEAEELAAFRNFAQASNLNIDEGSP